MWQEVREETRSEALGVFLHFSDIGFCKWKHLVSKANVEKML